MSWSPELLPLLLAWFLVFVFSTTLHEAAHAFAARRLGDPTAYHGGQVSLNPAPHIQREPLGMVVVPIVSFLLMNGSWMFGWASAPYDPQWALRYPRKAAWMALAGPLGNLALVLLSIVALRLGLASGLLLPPEAIGFSEVASGSGSGATAGLATVLSILFTLNLVLFVFNLLPLPPLDGGAVIQLFMSEGVGRRYQEFLFQYPMWAWVGIVVAWRFFTPVFVPVYRFTVGTLLYPGLFG